LGFFPCCPFKDLGARLIAHKNTKTQLERLQPPNIVLPDEVVDSKHTLTLGGTTLELLYVGRNHSDNSLVMRLPKERIIFAVDFIPVQAVFWRSMPDSWLDEWEASLKRVLAMDWDKLIPGHPGPGGHLAGRQRRTILLPLSQWILKAQEPSRFASLLRD
jgi:glyoxylase-like metal-dependent hydrolase (beta-lactamase superfamily II)